MAEQKLYGSSLIKAKQILDYMVTTTEAPELKDISSGTGIGKPTTLKLLETMATLGLIRKVGDEKKYFLGTDFIAYAEKASNDFDLLQYAKPALSKLRDATDETINLGIESNNSVVLLAKMESQKRSIKLKSQVGGRMNLYSSSMGKAILSTWTPEELDQYTEQVDLNPVGPNTITTTERLFKEIGDIQRCGYSIDNEENEPEVFCLGFSLCKNGKLVGAFSITAPKYRMTKKNREKYLVLAKQTQQEIEKAL